MMNYGKKKEKKGTKGMKMEAGMAEMKKAKAKNKKKK